MKVQRYTNTMDFDADHIEMSSLKIGRHFHKR